MEVLHRPNVTLSWESIKGIVEDGIELKSGEVVPLDVIIFGTGYSLVRGPAEAIGFIPYIGHRNPWTYVSEGARRQQYKSILRNKAAQRHISIGLAIKLIRPILDGKAKSFEVRDDATDKYNAWLQRRLARSVWTDCNSYYQVGRQNQTKIIATFPGPVALFWWFCRRVRWDDFIGVEAGEWEKQRRRTTFAKRAVLVGLLALAAGLGLWLEGQVLLEIASLALILSLILSSFSPTMSSHPHSSTANLVGVHYRVGKKIGEGSFGVIFEGTNLLNSQTVAIKFEPRKAEAPQLRDECRSYRILAGCTGIPQIYHFGQEGLHNILVIDLLGPSLEDLFDMCGRKFSIKTVCMAARQMLSRVQTIHEKNLIYRDIKPDNFLIGRPGTKGSNVVHVVDFGMAKQYRDPKTKQHIPYREQTHGLIPTEQSRRDDLEALGHVFMYFLRGSLPWQGLKAATNKQKYEKIGEKKQTTPIKELCEGFPEEFGIYLNYVRKLGFEETPDYDFLRELFAKVLKSSGEIEDGAGSSPILSQMQNAGLVQDRRRDNRESDRRRSQGGNVVPPSPALVRHGSKQRRGAPGALTTGAGTPGQYVPHSAAAQINVPVSTAHQHPYANPSTGAYDYGRDIGDDAYGSQQQYGRASPMVSTIGAAPPAVSNVRARGGEAGISHSDGYNGQQAEDVNPKPSFFRILTCRC
ncbi:hypothetical protein DXG03_000797 [Asterophora parasitica]|uniref:non-specific serine/threonine protein kinase n=1 Tax=Asterophora parasitica TaxID=117018 RepID=A0A9P7GHR6_9AGAR|nr:hypothetical protein DXG03_000797 [Asterophora parasitica]